MLQAGTQVPAAASGRGDLGHLLCPFQQLSWEFCRYKIHWCIASALCSLLALNQAVGVPQRHAGFPVQVSLYQMGLARRRSGVGILPPGTPEGDALGCRREQWVQWSLGGLLFWGGTLHVGVLLTPAVLPAVLGCLDLSAPALNNTIEQARI